VSGRFSPRRVFLVFLVATLLVQAAWILTTPAFRGSDEFDHVYKAEAVARGQWNTSEAAQHGRGGIVTIPGDVVRAASAVCSSYPYTGHDNCYPIRSVGNGQVEVATAASAYNPAYYVVVGPLARPFSGAGADYAMRVVTAVLCALLIAWSAAVTARWARTAWPLICMSIGLTPVLVYSTATAAPNGITYAAAALVWSVVVALSRTDIDHGGLAAPLTIGSVAVVTTHTTGTMWLALVFAVAVLLAPLRHWLAVLRRRPRTWVLSAAVVGVATALSLSWIAFAHTNSLGTTVLEPDPFPLERLPVFEMLWALQAIAAFPLRNEPAPMPVYVMWGLPLLAVLAALFTRGSRRDRVAGAVALLVVAVVPAVLTLMSYRTQGVAWQGRYSLPFWLGMTAIAGSVLDRRPIRPLNAVPAPLYAVLATAMTVSTVVGGWKEAAHGPADPVAATFPGGFLLVGLLTIAGCLLPLMVVGRSAGPPSIGRRPRPETEPAGAVA
jgi:hypothetical protein